MGLAGCRRVHEGGAEPLLSGEELNRSLDALQLVLPPFAPDQVEPGPFVDGSGHQDFARSGSGLGAGGRVHHGPNGGEVPA